MQSLDDKIGHLLSIPPYGQPPEEKQALLLALLKEELDYACQRHAGYGNYVVPRARAGQRDAPGASSSPA